MQKKNLKIGLFLFTPLTGGAGAEKYFIELASRLSLNNSVQVITPTNQFVKLVLRPLHILRRFDFFGHINLVKESYTDVKTALGSAEWFQLPLKNFRQKLQDLDIIYTKNELVELFLLKLVGYKNLPPVVVGVHTPLQYSITSSIEMWLHNKLYSSFIYRWLLSEVTVVHASNQFTVDFVQAKFPTPVRLIYYPFSTEELWERARSWKYSLDGFDPSRLNIVFVGRLTAQKGISSLLGLIESISRTPLAERVQFSVFGDGDLTSKVMEAAARHSFFTYYGFVPNKYIPNILERHDLFISTARWEVLPFNVLEAQAMGLPVLAFDIPGPRDIIANKETGILVANEDELLSSLMHIVEGFYTFDSAHIRVHVKKRFDPSLVFNEIQKFLFEVSARHA